MRHTGLRVARARLGGALAVIALFWARSSGAHITLLEPTPRVPGLSADPNADLKQGPCGQEQNGRSQNVNVFAPGETIRVSFDEFTNHTSYYRVAFDIEGDDDFPIFPGPGTAPEGDDPTRTCPVDGRVILAYELADGAGLVHTLQVKLPDVECESCTLQVIQYMYDTGRPYYFQCADLALRSPRTDAGALDAGPDSADASSAQSFRAAASCSQPLPPRPRRDGGSSMEPPRSIEPEPPNAGDPALEGAAPPARARRGGCSFAGTSSAAHSLGGIASAVALLSFGWVASRRRARSGLRRA